MAKRDGPAIGIDPVWVKAEVFVTAQAWAAEGFIAFDDLKIIDAETGTLKRHLDAGTGPMPMTRGATPPKP